MCLSASRTGAFEVSEHNLHLNNLAMMQGAHSSLNSSNAQGERNTFLASLGAASLSSTMKPGTHVDVNVTR